MKNRNQKLPRARMIAGVMLFLTGGGTVRAGDIVVANNADSGNGTFRQAIQFNESVGGGSRILFSNTVTGTITLTNALGELFISKDVTIVGPGAKALTISGNYASRVFHLANSAAVSISGLTVSGGYLQNFGANGAGMLQDSGTLTLTDCAIASNFNLNGIGGGIYANGTVTANGCTFSGDQGVQVGFIGAGAVYVGGGLTAVNCTFYGNLAGGSGGAIYQAGGALALTNCTLSGNNAFVNGSGGGIYKAGGTATIRNTIIAGNLAATGPDCVGAFTSAGFNLIGAMSGSSGWGSVGDQLGTTNSPLNPLLGTFQDNGGATLTLALQSGSPAIDQGNGSGVMTDQRGAPRPVATSSVGSIPFGGDRSDIGAYELGLPLLTIRRAPQVTLSWPAYYGGLTLQTTTNLTAPGSWTNVPGTPVVVGNQWVTTNGPAAGSQFFRLQAN